MLNVLMAAILALPQVNGLNGAKDPVVVGPIDDLQVVSFDGTSLRMQWTAPPWDPFMMPLGYEMKVATAAISDANYLSLPGATSLGSPGSAGTLEDRTVDVSALGIVNSPGVIYHIGVVALFAGGRDGSPTPGGVSIPNGQLACESIAPGLATSVTASSPTISSATLDWDAPRDDASNPSSPLVWRFRIYHSTKAPSTFANTAAWIADPQTRALDATYDGFNPAPQLETLVSGLTADATWHFVIGSLDEWSNESLSASVSATTPAMPDLGPGGGGGGGNTGACSAGASGALGLAILAAALAASSRS